MARGILLGAEGSTGGRVVGRERELAALAAFVGLRRATAPAAIVLDGEAGIGKTTVMGAALAAAEATGLRVMSARPAAGEVELPYAGLADLVSGYDDDSLGFLAEPQRAAIAAAVRRRGTYVDAHALSRGVLELLRVEGEAGDLLVVVDDVQWLDRPTATALGFALRRLGRVPVRVLVAARPAAGVLGDLPLGLADWSAVQRLSVGPLSATELGAVVRERLGEELPRPRLEALERATAGNPMFALELVRRGPGGWLGGGPATLDAAVMERLRTMEESVRAVLATAAAALRPTISLLLGAGVRQTDLSAALDTGALDAREGRLAFAHPLLAAAAYELLLPGDRREVHARLAASSQDVVERGHHVSRSVVEPDACACNVLERAAEEASKLGDHSGAAAFFRRAAELSPVSNREAAPLRELRAALELDLAGDVIEAAALARALLVELPPGTTRARARLLLVYCTIGSTMSYEEGIVQLDSTLEEVQEDAAMRAELHLAMTDFSSAMCRLDDAVFHARAAIELAESTGANTLAVAALAELGFAECMQGQGVSEAARVAFARWDETIVSPNGYSPRMALALALLHTTAFDDAELLLMDELRMAEECGLEPVEVMARGHLAETQLRAGRWDEALSNARRAVEHARQATHQQIVTGASYGLAMTHALMGDHELARPLAERSLAEARRTNDFWFEASHRAVLGFLALTHENAGVAVDVLEPAWTMMVERGLGDLSIFPVAQVLGEAMVEVGRLDDATHIAEALRDCPAGGRPWCRAIAGRLSALIAGARGDFEAMRSEIAAALDAHGELPEPFEYARTLEVRGRLERKARNWGAARAALVEALERFDALGASSWAEKTAAEIARLPGRPPGDRTALTAREREIAALVAQGLGNKEIASRLFLSLRTIEANLSRVYAKLGVRSRTELAARWRPDDS